MELLQIATASFITNCDRYYEVRWISYKLRQYSISRLSYTNNLKLVYLKAKKKKYFRENHYHIAVQSTHRIHTVVQEPERMIPLDANIREKDSRTLRRFFFSVPLNCSSKFTT